MYRPSCFESISESPLVIVVILPVLSPVDPVSEPVAENVKQYLSPLVKSPEVNTAVVPVFEEYVIPGQGVAPVGIDAVLVLQPEDNTEKSDGNAT